jgi:hypothetical protein
VSIDKTEMTMVYSASMHALFDRRNKRRTFAGCKKKKEEITDIPGISNCRPADAEPEISQHRDPALAKRL